MKYRIGMHVYHIPNQRCGIISSITRDIEAKEIIFVKFINDIKQLTWRDAIPKACCPENLTIFEII